MSDTLERLRKALADRYSIEREIGSGGMATVYLAHDLKHERKVALKVLRPELAAALGPERFHQEIKIAANLTHPHILPLHDSGDAEGFLYYVMPHIEGQSLRDKLAKEGELPIAEAVRILRDVVDALSEAHEKGVVHRDIKPDNVLLTKHHALVTDFGVAKAVSEATGAQRLTTEGVALGTPAYMSPEQAAADKHIDHRADIYAVGAVAYELLTGRPPFLGTTPQEVLASHVTKAVEPVTEHRATVPPALAQLVMKCLEKKPADRWQSAEELLPQLEALATPSGGMTPTDTRPVAALGGGRRWLIPTVLGSAAAVIVLAFVGVQVLKRSPVTVTVSNIRPVTSAAGKEWLPALSPDGSEVAFVANRGDVRSVVVRSTRGAVGSGELTPAAEVRAWQPEWSHDGETIRFLNCESDGLSGCTWMETGKLGGSIRTSGLPRTGAFASWSPDGSRVALLPGRDSLFVHSLADGTTSLLAIAPEPFNHTPVWSPDGRRIAFVDGSFAYVASLQDVPSSIWIVDVDDGDPVRVTSGEFVDFSPVWLDADHLLFTSNRDGPREVYLVEAGPSGPHGAPRKVAGLTDAHTISYSPAAQVLAFAKASVRQNVWSYPLGPGTTSIADGQPVTTENAITRAHHVSPDGRQIAYSSDLGHTGNFDLYARALEGGSPTLIAEGPLNENDPQWSPEGTEIAYVVGGSRLLVVPVDGGTPIQAASGFQVFRPTWSPTGLELAYICRQESQEPRLELCVVSREAIGAVWGEATRLTDFGCWPQGWTPDGSGVLCQVVDITGGNYVPSEAVIVSRQGAVLWRYDPASDGLTLRNGHLALSQDGSIIYDRARRNDGTEGVWAIPVQGGEPRLVVAFDDDEWSDQIWLAVRGDRLYLTVRQDESDIWVADVEVER